MTQTHDSISFDSSKGPVLVLDTAGRACQAAIYVDGQCCAYRNPEMAYGQAEWLIPLVQDVAAEAGVNLTDLKAVITTVGPGSFTGLRVGLAAAKGFGIAANCPVVGVTSLAAWAVSVLVDETQAVKSKVSLGVRVILDSRRGDAFVQDFDASGQAICEPAIQSFELAKDTADGKYLVGDMITDQPAPELTGIFAAIRNKDHQVPAHPVYLREADAVPMAQKIRENSGS